MNIQKNIDVLLGAGEKLTGVADVVPKFLEPRYDRLAAIENLREAAICNSSTVAALKHVLIADDEDEVREAAISTLCEICNEIEQKQIALLIAAEDASDRVLTTVLEQANMLDDEFALQIAHKLLNHQDPIVSDYAKGMIDRLK